MVQTPPVKKIAFVDDDVIGSRLYLDALRAKGFLVEYFPTVTVFLKQFRQGAHFDLCVIDLMMPGGSTYHRKETANGLMTGLCVVREIHQSAPELPFIVISTVNVDVILEKVGQEIDAIDQAVFVRKSLAPPESLSVIVERVATKGIKAANKSGLLAKLVDLIVLQPSIYGIGLDFKKLRGKKEVP